MIKRISNFIVNKRILILAIMLLLAVISAFCSQFVEVNEDMTKYLPDDSNMKNGMELMEEEFPEMETSNTIRVMFDDLNRSQKEDILEKLAAIAYVDSVDYDIESSDYNKDNHTLYVLNFSCDYGSEEELAIESALDTEYNDYTMVWLKDDSELPSIPLRIIIVVMVILLTILFVMCGSWIEPILFLFTIGVAVVINSGTNLIMGSVASITNSISVILQLVLSIDYSIILMNRYRQEKKLEPDKVQAMKNALSNAFSSVASSSLTTVVGLLMLVFMSFKIGADLGIVLAKGVFISMVCVLTMLPGILLACDKLIVKTAKKEPHIPMNWAGRFSYKMRYVMTGLFVILFISAYILQQQTGIAYTLAKNDVIADVFPKDNMLVMIYENQDEDAVSDLAANLEKDENIKSVMGYSTILGKPYTSCELADALTDMGEDISLNSGVIDMLYYDYYKDGVTGTMTASEFLSFVSDTVMNDETFSGYIDDDMKEHVDMLTKFSNAGTLTKPMTADELADFFEMDASDINDLFLLYYIEHGGVPTDNMTLTAFSDFVINEVAKDAVYGSMFDETTVNKMSQLANFADSVKMTTPYTYHEIASMLDMDDDTAKLLFIYYYALSDNYDPGVMTLPEFVSFLQKDIAKDSTFSSYLNADTMRQIQTLALYTDTASLQKQRTANELSSMLGIDESMMKMIFILHNAQDVSGKTMSLTQFTSFLNSDLLNNPMLRSSFDEASIIQLQTLDALIQLTASNQEFTPEQMAQTLGMDENTIYQLYYLYFSSNEEFQSEAAAMTMTLPDFLTLLKANSSEEEQTQLAQMEQVITLAVSGQELTASQLSEITHMEEEQISVIFANQEPTVESMTLSAFLNIAIQECPDNIQLLQLNQLVQLAASGTLLDSSALAEMFGIEQVQVQQLFMLTLASQKTSSLASFTAFLVNDVLTDEAYAANFTEEQKTQLANMNQMVQLAASGTLLNPSALAAIFGMDEELIEMVFRLYYGNDISGKTMSLENTVDFILSDSVMRKYMNSTSIGQLQMMQQMIKASVNHTAFTYNKLAKLLGMDSNMLKILYTVHASKTEVRNWSVSMYTLVNFLVDNQDALNSAMGKSQMNSLTTAQAIINGSVNGISYTSDQLASLMGMSKDQDRQLYLLYTSRHGDTSGWTLSVKGFIDFIMDDVLSDSEYADKLDADTTDSLSSARTMVDAVIYGKPYTAAEMGILLGGLSEDLEPSMIELLYLYAESQQNTDPTWTMTLETLFNYMIDDVLHDSRFSSVIDPDMRQTLLDAQKTLDEGKEQLVSDQYSRLVITTSYPEEGEDTTAFLYKLEEYGNHNLNGNYYLVGSSAMNHEMQKTFDDEFRFITMLTVAAIFLIVALTFKSIVIPAILVLLVQCGVYITVTVTGLMSGSMYYLALLIVECILMGATIDYGILFTNYYRESRRLFDVKKALKKAYAGSIHTIMTSGLILVTVTGVVGGMFEEATVQAIVKTLSIGSFCAIVLILFILPGILAVCDKLVAKIPKHK